jgi:hypothetical protein
MTTIKPEGGDDLIEEPWNSHAVPFKGDDAVSTLPEILVANANRLRFIKNLSSPSVTPYMPLGMN